ncbi:MAG: hypothetical protein F4039_10040 [Gammaproteobacteria bacterium]|nr:hypothetical protein [Gammaproteobacteria bacterium]MYF52305.1 hypothetical protein [Gammaproteobacteria bacterium]MYK44410.1 hypothetical protein [Gammaproteobacteria bacterium]
MKTVLPILLLVLLPLSLSAQDKRDLPGLNLYIVGGPSFYPEDVDAAVGEGLGIRIGAGMQFTERFGVEWLLDITPNIETYLISEILDELIGDTYKLETTGHIYSSLFATTNISLTKGIDFVAKLGYSSHVYEVIYEFQEEQSTTLARHRYREKENTPVAALGFQFPIRRERESTLEISITRFLKENVNATALNISLKQVF